MIRRDLAWWINVARAVVALLAALGVLSIAENNPGGLTTDTKTVPVRVPIAEPAPASESPAVIATDGADQDAKADDPVVLTPKAQDVAEDLADGAVDGTNDLAPAEGDVPLVGTDPPGPVAELAPPYASDSIDGCKTRFLTTNWSYRSPGIAVTTFDLHYTAGPDVPNSRSDVDGLTAYGNNPSARVSWHLNMDKDGNCDYNVPFRYKAWTIGDLNSASINMEVHGRGEAPYLRPAGYRKLARIYVQIRRAYPAIKLRLASYRDCGVTRSGIGTHWMAGLCSGGHSDIKPLDIRAVIRELRKYVRALTCDKKCRHAKALRAKHARTHERFRKNHCKGKTAARYGYCNKLRARNKTLHRAARKAHVRL